jgi:hypothetical protein
VDPAAITITANDESKAYGTLLTPAGTEFTVTGTMYNGDSVTSVTLNSAGYPALAPTSPPTYPIVPSLAVGFGLGNYTITYANGTLTVTGYTINGLVELDHYVGLNGIYETVTAVFVATTDAAGLNVVASWEGPTAVVCPYSAPYTFSYQLLGVPTAAAYLSVQPTNNASPPTTPSYYLRRKLPVTFVSGVAQVDFTEANSNNQLLGGDLNCDGQVDTLDYLILVQNWGTGSYLADINGDGSVDALDYGIMQRGWYHSVSPDVTTDGKDLKAKSSDSEEVPDAKAAEAVKEQTNARE